MLRGRGILLIMAEPTPTLLGLRGSFAGDTKGHCVHKVRTKIWSPLGRGELPYRFILFNGDTYQVMREEYLRSGREQKIRVNGRVNLNFGKALDSIIAILPDAYFEMTLPELKRGAIVDKILASADAQGTP
jgi:hypothetical protein